MSRMADQDYLLSQQYRDETNLNARIALHQRFSTNQQGWFPWLFEQLSLPPRCRILELGCGPGDLWLQNLERIPSGWHMTLSDLSAGMVRRAQRSLADRSQAFDFQVIDAQSIPFADGSCDAVFANHVLYHVPDRDKALSEMRRVLRPGGKLYASTVGEAHLRELYHLVGQIDAEAFGYDDSACEPFLLENGGIQLSRWFTEVRLHRYDDGLIVTEAEPLIAYILSTATTPEVPGGKLAALRTLVEHELASNGSILITKDSGLFEAVREDGQPSGERRVPEG